MFQYIFIPALSLLWHIQQYHILRPIVEPIISYSPRSARQGNQIHVSSYSAKGLIFKNLRAKPTRKLNRRRVSNI